MESLVSLFGHLLVFCFVGALLYWMVTLVVALLPPPVGQVARTLLLLLLCLIAISALLGEAGLWGEWGYGYRLHHR